MEHLVDKLTSSVEKGLEDTAIQLFDLRVFNGVVAHLQTNPTATKEALLGVVREVLDDSQIKKVDIVSLFKNKDPRMNGFLPMTKSGLELFINAQSEGSSKL